tara:strand:- start:161 stop:379 length:219 start_codon:yes stop_codon:yes gene_type:complete
MAGILETLRGASKPRAPADETPAEKRARERKAREQKQRDAGKLRDSEFHRQNKGGENDNPLIRALKNLGKKR